VEPCQRNGKSVLLCKKNRQALDFAGSNSKAAAISCNFHVTFVFVRTPTHPKTLRKKTVEAGG